MTPSSQTHDFTLSFDSDAYEEHGDHTDVDYMNGEHSIQATAQDRGQGRAALMSNVMLVEFDNVDGYVVIGRPGRKQHA